MSFKKGIKSTIKSNPILYRYIKAYRKGHLFEKKLAKSVKGKGNEIKIHPSNLFVNSRIDIVGNNNIIHIDENGFFKNTTFYIRGSNNHIILSSLIQFNRGGSLWVEDRDCSIKIDSATTFEDAHIAVTEPNSKVYIGSDCMFANAIEIRTGDSHSIIDTTTGKRINKAQDVIIKNHVWVGAHVSILKGSLISSNSIVATRGLVTRAFDKPGILIAGIPAKEVRGNINWDRRRLYDYDMEDLKSDN